MIPGVTAFRRVVAPPVEVGAHRYWRLKVNSGVSSSEAIVCTLRLQGAPGGADLAPTASEYIGTVGTSGSSYGPAKAFDQNDTSFWQHSAPYVDTFMGCVFAEAVAITQYQILYGIYGEYGVSGWDFQWSDDGVSWTTVDSQAGKSWTNGVAQTFAFADAELPDASAPHAYWALFIDSTEYMLINELELRGVAGGPSLTTGGSAIGTPSDSGTPYDPVKAFDGASNDGNNAWQRSNAPGRYLGYHFATPVTIAEYSFGSLNYMNYMPTAWRLCYSDDGVIWSDADTRTGISWTTFQTKTFSILPNSDEFAVDSLADYVSTGGASWSIDGGLLLGAGGTQATLTRNDISQADIRAELDLVAAQDAGLVARWINTDNQYIATIHDASSTTSIPNQIQLYKKVAGAFTQLGSNATIAFVRGTQHTLALVVSGDSIVVEFDNAPVISVSDASLSAPGSAGPRVSNGAGTTGRIDVSRFSWGNP